MSQKLWIKYKTANKVYDTKVSTADCNDADDFIDAIKKKFPHLFGTFITLSNVDGIEIQPETAIENIFQPVIVTVVAPSIVSISKSRQ